MKLLYCHKCGDVFQLRLHVERSCECGEVTGRYIDRTNAVTNGKGASLAIGNGSLHDALTLVANMSSERAFYPVMCWARPNEGPANPHTKIEG
jgi:hypothetical protein